MPVPGWYPDPKGQPGHVRYWDGSRWQGLARPAAATTPPKTADRPDRSPAWLVLAAVLIVAVVGGWFLTRGSPGAQPDTNSASPTGSHWDELAPVSSSPPEPSEATQVPCPEVTQSPAPLPSRTNLTNGRLSAKAPPNGSASRSGVSRLLTNHATFTYSYPDSSWLSFVSVGTIPADAGFTDPATTARQVSECHLTSGNFTGLESYDVVNSETITVDGHPGHWMRIAAVNSRTPGGGAIFDSVVIDSADPAGLQVYWSGVVNADSELLSQMDATRASIQVA